MIQYCLERLVHYFFKNLVNYLFSNWSTVGSLSSNSRGTRLFFWGNTRWSFSLKMATTFLSISLIFYLLLILKMRPLDFSFGSTNGTLGSTFSIDFGIFFVYSTYFSFYMTFTFGTFIAEISFDFLSALRQSYCTLSAILKS